MVDKGNDVYAIDNFSTGKMKNFAHATGSRHLNIIRADVRRPAESTVKRIKRVDCVCHLAAMTSVQESIRDPRSTTDVNVIGTLRVLEMARRLGADRVILASSAAVYGMTQDLPAKEDTPVAPISPYGVSKAACELYCSAFEHNHGIQVFSLRYFNVYGPRQTSSQYSGVISIFAKKLLRGRSLRIFGDGSQTRDFVYVSDVVDGTIQALEGDGMTSRVFNIAGGAETSILGLAETMKNVVGSHSDLTFSPSHLGDLHRSCADIARARKELNYHPKVPLKDGLTQTIQYFADEGAK